MRILRGATLALGPVPPQGLETIQSMLAARLGVLFVLLGISIVQQIFQVGSNPVHVLIGYGLLTIAFAFNSLWSVLPEKVSRGIWASVAQVLFDAAVITLWIHLAGEKENLYSLLYLVQILFVALILYQRAALFTAAVAGLGFGIALAMDPPEGAWLMWSVNAVLFLTLGFVGGYLSEELHRTTERLAEKSDKIERLIALQQRIISNLPTGLITVDAALRIGFVNPAAAVLLGIDPEEAVGRPMAEVAPGLMPFFLSSEPSRLQQVVQMPSGGHDRILRGDVALLEAVGGAGGLLHASATSGQVLLFQDVTKVFSLEERVKQNEKLAAVGQLAAGIAHEIRNPLAGMSASIEMLRSGLPLELVSREDHKLMDIALREIDRLNQLISEFLDYVKPQQMKLEAVDLSKLVSDILFGLRHPEIPGRIKSLKGAVPVRTDIDLKESYGEKSVVIANPEKLKQVLLNLIINAIQAMDKPGTIEIGCERTAGTAEQRVIFWVTDQGQGMSEKTLSHLYEPFFTTKEKGTGLGLATAYKLVEAMHGEIRVESKVGQGTRFEVVLPAA